MAFYLVTQNFTRNTFFRNFIWILISLIITSLKILTICCDPFCCPGDEQCLTDATLTGGNYTWSSTGEVTFFDKDMTTKTESCVTLSGKAGIRGLTPNCDANCVICQRGMILNTYLYLSWIKDDNNCFVSFEWATTIFSKAC